SSGESILTQCHDCDWLGATAATGEPVPWPHTSWISSRLRPLVSGTYRITKMAASTLMPPYSQYGNPWWNKLFSVVFSAMILNVVETRRLAVHCAATARAMAC